MQRFGKTQPLVQRLSATHRAANITNFESGHEVEAFLGP